MSQDSTFDSEQSKQQVCGVFDRAATTYDHVGPRFFSHFGRRLVELAEIPKGATVLDVATGRGAVLFSAATSVGTQGHVIGIDLSEIMVKETAQELARLDISSNAEVRRMDAEHLQFPNASFDYVLCGFAIFFFPQLYRAMSEFHRVLKPDGRIAVTTWDRLFDKQWDWFDEIVKTYLPPEPESDQPPSPDSPPQPVFDTPEGLEAIMVTAGFTDIQIISETAEFTYPTDEVLWSTLWSHGSRHTLERIETVTGSEGIQRFKADVIKKFQVLKQTDGMHQLFPVLFAIGTRPWA